MMSWVKEVTLCSWSFSFTSCWSCFPNFGQHQAGPIRFWRAHWVLCFVEVKWAFNKYSFFFLARCWSACFWTLAARAASCWTSSVISSVSSSPSTIASAFLFKAFCLWKHLSLTADSVWSSEGFRGGVSHFCTASASACFRTRFQFAKEPSFFTPFLPESNLVRVRGRAAPERSMEA